MRTARALTVSPIMLCAGGAGGCLLWEGGVSAPVGCVCSWGSAPEGSAPGGSAPGGCLLKGVSAPGGRGSALWGVSAPRWCLLRGWWYPSMH